MRTIEIRDAVVAAVVVRVRQDVASPATVVPGACEGVRHAEADAARRPALDLRLQAVVLRSAGGLVERDAAEAEIRTQRVDVDEGVRLDRARLQLIDVARAFEVRRRSTD